MSDVCATWGDWLVVIHTLGFPHFIFDKGRQVMLLVDDELVILREFGEQLCTMPGLLA